MYDVELIRKLAQEEGMNDRQIAEAIGCNRVTVTRIRKRNDIPLCEKDNRRDKSFICLGCGNKQFIRRVDFSRAFCDECLSKPSITEDSLVY